MKKTLLGVLFSVLSYGDCSAPGVISASGNVTLLSGTVTVPLCSVHPSSRILLSVISPSTNLGQSYILSISDGVNFVIESTDSADNSTLSYLVVN